MNIRRGLQLWSTRQTRGSNMKLISIGFGNSVNADRIVAVAAPVKRIVQLAKDSGTAIDATCGRRTRSVIICDSGHVVMSAQTPETLAGKTAKPGADEEPED